MQKKESCISQEQCTTAKEAENGVGRPQVGKCEDLMLPHLGREQEARTDSPDSDKFQMKIYLADALILYAYSLKLENFLGDFTYSVCVLHMVP